MTLEGDFACNSLINNGAWFSQLCEVVDPILGTTDFSLLLSLGKSVQGLIGLGGVAA